MCDVIFGRLKAVLTEAAAAFNVNNTCCMGHKNETQLWCESILICDGLNVVLLQQGAADNLCTCRGGSRWVPPTPTLPSGFLPLGLLLFREQLRRKTPKELK